MAKFFKVRLRWVKEQTVFVEADSEQSAIQRAQSEYPLDKIFATAQEDKEEHKATTLTVAAMKADIGAMVVGERND